jgi:hypothetical protein
MNIQVSILILFFASCLSGRSEELAVPSNLSEKEIQMARTGLAKFLTNLSEGKVDQIVLVPKLRGIPGQLGPFGDKPAIATDQVGYFIGEDVSRLIKGLGKPTWISAYDCISIFLLVPLFSDAPTKSTSVVECTFVGDSFAVRIRDKVRETRFDVLYDKEFSAWIRARLLGARQEDEAKGERK